MGRSTLDGNLLSVNTPRDVGVCCEPYRRAGGAMLRRRCIGGKRRTQRGQGVTEYGAILAFASVLIVMVFFAIPGDLGRAIATCFTNLAVAITELVQRVS